jgi:hypothetical protein
MGDLSTIILIESPSMVLAPADSAIGDRFSVVHTMVNGL